MTLSRRNLIAGASALLAAPACAKQDYISIPPLKSLLASPLGVAMRDLHLDDPEWTQLATAHFSRLTAEWETKMEYVLKPDGTFQFDRSDRLASFARDNGMTVHGHTLIWYEQDGEPFQKLKGNRDAFLAFYADYIKAVMTRYRGVATGWDVVNEPIMFEGEGLRDCLWRQVLGDDYIGMAFAAAHEADPSAVLFVNEYHLEHKPVKRKALLKLVETLLKSGAPVTGIGTQTHISAEIKPGQITEAMRDIASLGLKVHVSEVDIAISDYKIGSMAEPRLDQIRALEEIVTAYKDLPAGQQYGLTFWGLRDSDSWINAPRETNGRDEPLLFDKMGRPKPLTAALVKVLG
jgi:endo-1,4-beta-xylanase